MVSPEKGNGEHRSKVVRKGVHGGIFCLDGYFAFVYRHFLFCCGDPDQCMHRFDAAVAGGVSHPLRKSGGRVTEEKRT